MPVQLSPGVNVTEYDLTTIVPAVSTSTGAIAGVFGWGPLGEAFLIDSEPNLVSIFGQPTNLNPETFFTAANFLAYGNSLYVSRAANTAGATPAISFYSNSITGSNSSTFIIASGNTNSLSNGMYISQSGNTSIVSGSLATTINVINSTAISIPSVVTTSNTPFNLYFANPGTAYNSLALASNSALVANLVGQIVTNDTYYYANTANNFDSNVLYVAKYPGSIGNSLRVAVCDSANAFSSNIALFGYANATSAFANAVTGNAYSGSFTTSIGSNTATIVLTGSNTIATNTAAWAIYNDFTMGDNILTGNASIGFQYLSISNISNVVTNASASAITFNFQAPYRLHTAYTSNTSVQRYWEFYNAVGTGPGQSQWVQVNGNTSAQDQLSVVVVDDNGMFSGTPGTVLETYKNVSRATDAQNADGSTEYYVNVINKDSKYIWWANDRSGAASATSLNVSSSTNQNPGDFLLTLGADGYSEAAAPLSILGTAYNYFANKETVQVDLVMQGRPSGASGQTYQVANYIIDNITTQRKDCVAFISPDKSLMLNNYGAEATSMVNWVANNLHSTSYAVIDTGYKYQYDKYNDINRWIPLNGDIAGLCARTDQTNAPWWSPAGLNRGQIKNIIKLAYNPGQTDRDVLYSNNINPVITLKGTGTILYGDKTYQTKPSAFDRINVRRLFIVLERAISIAAKYSLFEFNDAFTQAQFRNLVNPYLRTVQGQRGITDFLVVCDATNNTPAVVDANQFVGDIYIKPARSINFIQLNFVAVATGVQFSQVVGSF